MALMFMDGFDYSYYSTYDTPYVNTRGWTKVGYLQAHETNGRRGRGCVGMMNVSWSFNQSGGYGQYLQHDTMFNDQTTVIAGCAYKPTTLPIVSHPLMTFGNDTDWNVSIHMSETTIYAMLGTPISTTVIGSATISAPVNEWHYYEAKVTIDNSTGAVLVKMDGTTVLNLTNVDTLVAGNAWTRRIILGGASVIGNDASYGLIDDFYACDTTGATNNDFLGDVRIDTLAVTGNGDFSDFTPLSGSNYQNVDETAVDGDTTYVSSSTAGNKDLYAMSDLSHNPSSIFAANVCAVARKSDSSAGFSRVVLKSGATTLNGSTDTLLETYKTFMLLRETDPNTSSAWTQTNVNLIQAGVEVM